MRTTQGARRVDVIYRRIDDDFIDPLTFRPNSALGVPGLMSAYQAGNVTLANAVGTGIADDKAVYSFMPEIIKFYLGEEPILKNVPTWRCREEEHLAYTLDHLHELVIKEVHGSGGFGMLIGPAAGKVAIEQFRAKLKTSPKNFISQPTLALSTCPTCVEHGVAPRRVVGRLLVGFGPGLIAIHLVEHETVGIVGLLEHVEPQVPRLRHRPQMVRAGRLDELRRRLGKRCTVQAESPSQEERK